MPSKAPFGAINPFKRVRKDYKKDDKYIPQFVIKQLDVLFKKEAIPVHYRLVYWLLRAIPSRVSEVTNMKIDCLKPSYDSKVALFIPTWKQNGGYLEPELRSIYLNPEGENEGLKKKQEEQRQETVSKIEVAIRGFQDEKYQDITIQMLINATGITRPTFSKPHVQSLLEKYKIGKYKFKVKLPKSDSDKLKFLEEKILEYMGSNEGLENNIEAKDIKLKKLDEALKIAKLEIEYLNQEIYQLSKNN